MKKVFLLVALLALFTLAFTACGGNDDPAPTPQPTPAAAQPTPAQPAPEAAQAPEPVDEPAPLTGFIHEPRDFGGRILRIANWWDAPYVIGEFDEPDPFEDDAYFINRPMWDNARRVEKLFNVQLVHVNVGFDDYLETLTTTVLGGSPFADVVMLDGQHQLAAINGNLVRPWPRVSGSDIHGTQDFLMPRTIMDGEVWTVIETGPYASGFGLGVNLDIILAEGLPNPVELYERGEWTWAAMLEIMRGATRSTDGSGVINQWGLGGFFGGGGTGLMSHIIAANDGIQVDSNFNFALDHPNTLYALEFIETIMLEELWFSDAGVMGGDWGRDMYAGIQEGNVALFTNTTWIPAEAGGIDHFEMRWVPFPRGPHNTSGRTWAVGLQQGYGIAASSDWDAEDILIIMEELFAWPGEDTDLIWQAGHYWWMLGVYQDYGCVLRGLHIGVSGNPEIGLGAGDDFGDIIGAIGTALWNREMGIMEAIEYHRGPAQEVLDSIFR